MIQTQTWEKKKAVDRLWSSAWTYFHKTWGRCTRVTQVLCSPQAFFPGCRWRTRWLQTPPTARSCPPCWLELRGVKPSHGTSLNSHWRLQEVEMSLAVCLDLWIHYSWKDVNVLEDLVIVMKSNPPSYSAITDNNKSCSFCLLGGVFFSVLQIPNMSETMSEELLLKLSISTVIQQSYRKKYVIKEAQGGSFLSPHRPECKQLATGQIVAHRIP